MLDLKRKRKNRDVSKRKRHGDISEKHKKSKKHSKHHSHKDKKRKTVINTRTKCQNKVNGKKCFSTTSVQNFSAEGQIFSMIVKRYTVKVVVGQGNVIMSIWLKQKKDKND